MLCSNLIPLKYFDQKLIEQSLEPKPYHVAQSNFCHPHVFSPLRPPPTPLGYPIVSVLGLLCPKKVWHRPIFATCVCSSVFVTSESQALVFVHEYCIMSSRLWCTCFAPSPGHRTVVLCLVTPHYLLSRIVYDVFVTNYLMTCSVCLVLIDFSPPPYVKF
jgi:hypothetical protein